MTRLRQKASDGTVIIAKQIINR